MVYFINMINTTAVKQITLEV